jgi:hypothetical protein
MAALEGGAIANPDENRMVGHYWLRDPDLAPAELKSEIVTTLNDIEAFVSRSMPAPSSLRKQIASPTFSPSALAALLWDRNL